MRKIVLVVGVLCLLYVALGLVVGLLPVNFWSNIISLFIEQEPDTFYKIVPSEGANYQIFFVSFIGVVLITLSIVKFKKK